MSKFLIIVLSCFLWLPFFSCNSNSLQTTAQSADEISKSSNEKVNLRDAQQGINDDDSAMHYGAVIERICYKDDFRSFSGTTLGFKRETIKPENVEMLRSISEIDPATLENFIERNLKTKKLIDGYDVKFDIKPIDKKDSYENLLAFAHKKHQRIKSIIGLSRIGFNEDRTQSLTYFEFYGSDHQLKKSYILLGWDYSQGGAMVKDTKWIPAE